MRESRKQQKLFSALVIVPDEKAINCSVFAWQLTKKQKTLKKLNQQNKTQNPKHLMC